MGWSEVVEENLLFNLSLEKNRFINRNVGSIMDYRKNDDLIVVEEWMKPSLFTLSIFKQVSDTLKVKLVTLMQLFNQW